MPSCFFPPRLTRENRLPIADFVELAQARGLIAGNRKPLVLGGFEALNQTLATDQLCAIAAKMFQQGADGLHLFNYYSMPQEWRNTTLRTMADPAGALRLAPKCYRVDVRGRERPESTLGFSFRNGVPQTQLPVNLEPSFAGVGTLLPLRVSDELEPAGLESVTLGLGFSELPAGAQIEIAVNGARVPFESGVENQAGWTNTAYGSGGAPGSNDNSWNNYPSYLDEIPLDVTPIEFDLLLPNGVIGLRQGENTVSVCLVGSGVGRVTLEEVRLRLSHKQGAAAARL